MKTFNNFSILYLLAFLPGVTAKPNGVMVKCSDTGPYKPTSSWTVLRYSIVFGEEQDPDPEHGIVRRSQIQTCLKQTFGFDDEALSEKGFPVKVGQLDTTNKKSFWRKKDGFAKEVCCALHSYFVHNAVPVENLETFKTCVKKEWKRQAYVSSKSDQLVCPNSINENGIDLMKSQVFDTNQQENKETQIRSVQELMGPDMKTSILFDNKNDEKNQAVFAPIVEIIDDEEFSSPTEIFKPDFTDSLDHTSDQDLSTWAIRGKREKAAKRRQAVARKF